MKNKTKHNKTKSQVQGGLLALYKLRKRHPTREVCFQTFSIHSFLPPLPCVKRMNFSLPWAVTTVQNGGHIRICCSGKLLTFRPVLWCYAEPESVWLLETGTMMELHASGRLESGNEINAIFERVNRLLSWRQNLMPQLPALQEVLLLFLRLFPLQPLTSQKIQGEALQGFPRA